MLKPIFIGLLILFTFIGNVGMSVFTHSCKEDGVFRSYFVKTQDHCESNKKELVHPCCQPTDLDENEIHLKENNCCNDEVNVFKINLDYCSEYHVAISQVSICELPLNYNFAFKYINESVKSGQSFTDPPPRTSGRELLIKHQVFRI